MNIKDLAALMGVSEEEAIASLRDDKPLVLNLNEKNRKEDADKDDAELFSD